MKHNSTWSCLKLLVILGMPLIALNGVASSAEPDQNNKKTPATAPEKSIEEKTSEMNAIAKEANTADLSSLAFMESDSPLSQEDLEKAIELVETQIKEKAKSEPAKVKPVVQKPLFKEDDLSPMVSFPIQETCASTAVAGESICQKKYSDGSNAEIRIHNEVSGVEERHLTLVLDYAPNKILRSEKSIYQGTQYQDAALKQKEFEFFEIEYKPVSGNSSKEVLIYDFHRDTGKIRKVTWAQYESQPEQDEMTLVSHAFLTYEKDGTPRKGLAESLEDGYLTAQFLSWKDNDVTVFGSSQESWKSWENWITSRRIGFYVS